MFWEGFVGLFVWGGFVCLFVWGVFVWVSVIVGGTDRTPRMHIDTNIPQSIHTISSNPLPPLLTLEQRLGAHRGVEREGDLVLVRLGVHHFLRVQVRQPEFVWCLYYAI